MSFILAKAPISESKWMLADWIEFQVLISEFHFFQINKLLHIVDEDQEFENPNFVEQDTINEQLTESVLNEIQVRINSLNDSYPFYLNDDGTELLLHEAITPGGYSYLYCLFFSHINRDNVLYPDPPSQNSDRDLMQICSTIAAAARVSGSAVSFGYPRPDHTNFLTALSETYQKMGEGTVLENVPLGAPRYEKDGGIDVIAWGTTPDGCPGRAYLLGQVATGADWNGKSVKNDIDEFHSTWFSPPPPSTPIPAMFIPFCLDVKADETLEDVLHYKTVKFGEMYYRYRLPLFVEQGYEMAHQQGAPDVGRVNEFDKVIKYVNTFRETVLNI